MGDGKSGARGRDARTHVGTLRICGVARVRCFRDGRWTRATRATSGCAHRLLRGHRRAALSRRRRASLQPFTRRYLTHVSRWRLSILSAQHHTAAAIHRTARR